MEQHIPVALDGIVTSGSLCGVMVGTLARSAGDVPLILALGAIVSHFHHPHDTGCRDQDSELAM